MAKAGRLKGNGSGLFLPEDKIKRAEFIRLINRILNRNVKKYGIPEGILKFKDVSEDAWYYEDIVVASNSYIADRDEDGSQRWKELIKIVPEM